MALDATNPHHYVRLDPQPIEVIEAWKLPYLDGSVLKYLSRHREKNGAEDIRKAIWFLNRILETEYGIDQEGLESSNQLREGSSAAVDDLPKARLGFYYQTRQNS